MNNYKLYFPTLLTILFFLLFIPSCKDSESSSKKAQEEKCLKLVNKKSWDLAIKTCKAIKTDTGWSLTSDAYMGRASLSLVSLFSDLGGKGNKASKLLNYLPNTASKKADYAAGISAIIVNKTLPTKSDYMKVLIATTLIIYQSYIVSFNLDLAKVTSCATVGNPSFPCGDINYTNLYKDICNPTGSSPLSVIKPNSFLNYNKIASEALEDLGDLSVFNLYEQMDNGTGETKNNNMIADTEVLSYLTVGNF